MKRFCCRLFCCSLLLALAFAVSAERAQAQTGTRPAFRVTNVVSAPKSAAKAPPVLSTATPRLLNPVPPAPVRALNLLNPQPLPPAPLRALNPQPLPPGPPPPPEIRIQNFANPLAIRLR